MAKISVIIPLYNQGHFLKDSIQSLREQTFQDWEAIIVNDGSTDNSLEMAETLVGSDARFKIHSRVNGGLSAARNTGIDNCNGDFIALLDSDDVFKKSYLEVMVDSLNKNPTYGVSWCRSQETNENLQPQAPFREWDKLRVSERISTHLMASDPSLRLVWDNPLLPCGQLWRGDLIRRLKFDENLRSNEDWDILCRFEKKGGKFGFVPGIHSYYRRHGKSLNNDNRRMIETRIRCGVKNFASADNDQIARLSRLSLTLSSWTLDPTDPLLNEIPGSHEEDIQTFKEALSDQKLREISTLWCGGLIRSAKPHRGTRAAKASSGVKALLVKSPTTWRIGFERSLERASDALRSRLK